MKRYVLLTMPEVDTLREGIWGGFSDDDSPLSLEEVVKAVLDHPYDIVGTIESLIDDVETIYHELEEVYGVSMELYLDQWYSERLGFTSTVVDELMWQLMPFADSAIGGDVDILDVQITGRDLLVVTEPL